MDRTGRLLPYIEWEDDEKIPIMTADGDSRRLVLDSQVLTRVIGKYGVGSRWEVEISALCTIWQSMLCLVIMPMVLMTA